MASNEMDISTLSLDQLNQLKSQHEQELNQLRERHSSLKQAEGRFRQSKDALAAISKDDEGKSMLVPLRAGKGSSLGRFPLVSADFWTSDHLSERSRSMDAFSGARARGTLTLKRR